MGGRVDHAMFAFSSTSGYTFELTLPPGVTSLHNLVAAPELNSIIALATRVRPGDAGIVVLDLGLHNVCLLAVPEGFDWLDKSLAVDPSSRTIIALGRKTGDTAPQLIGYTLENGTGTLLSAGSEASEDTGTRSGRMASRTTPKTTRELASSRLANPDATIRDLRIRNV